LILCASGRAIEHASSSETRAWKRTRCTCTGNRSRCSPPTGPATPSRSSRTSRSEEHTSELQSRFDLVCRLLLEKKKKKQNKKKKRTKKKKQNEERNEKESTQSYTMLTSNHAHIDRY